MKNTIKTILFSFILLGLMILPGLVLAQTTSPGLGDAFSDATLGEVARDNFQDDSVDDVVVKAIRRALSILGLMFILLVFLAADVWMKAHGNPERVLKAKKILSQAIIGIAFVLIAYSLSNVLSQIFSDFILK